MPFKTKRQKIAAEVRRFSFGQTQINFPTHSTESEKTGESSMLVKKNMANLDYVRGDLFKILLIAMAVVIVQIGLALTLT